MCLEVRWYAVCTNSPVESSPLLTENCRNREMSMGYSQMHNESGFTLIEVLIALSIFAVGLLALASMQVTSLRGNANSQMLTAATALAEGTIEELLARSADDAEFDADAIDVELAGSPFSLDGGGSMRAYYSIDTTPPNTSGDFPTNVVRIDVRVEFGGGRQISLAGYKRVE